MLVLDEERINVSDVKTNQKLDPYQVVTAHSNSHPKEVQERRHHQRNVAIVIFKNTQHQRFYPDTEEI